VSAAQSVRFGRLVIRQASAGLPPLAAATLRRVAASWLFATIVAFGGPSQ
jgi:hypothetical protein